MNGTQDGSAEQVEAVLAELRAGVRQRQAVAAAKVSAREQALCGEVDLEAEIEVSEPLATSGRPVLGRLLVFARKAVFHVFLKWYLRPVLEQQNRAHRLLAQRLTALTAAHRELRRELEELRRRLDPPPQPDGEA